MDTATRSAIFTTYNKARKAAHQGKIDGKRLNRALGILQSAHFPDHYHPTTKDCQCGDHYFTGKPCKHMIAVMIQVRMSQAAPVAA